MVKRGIDESTALDVTKARMILSTLAFRQTIGITLSSYAYIVYFSGVIATDMTHIAYHKYEPVPEQLGALITRVATPAQKPAQKGKGLSSIGGGVLGQFAYKGGQAMGGYAKTAGDLAGSGLGASTSTIAKYLGKLGGYLS